MFAGFVCKQKHTSGCPRPSHEIPNSANFSQILLYELHIKITLALSPQNDTIQPPAQGNVSFFSLLGMLGDLSVLRTTSIPNNKLQKGLKKKTMFALNVNRKIYRVLKEKFTNLNKIPLKYLITLTFIEEYKSLCLWLVIPKDS